MFAKSDDDGDNFTNTEVRTDSLDNSWQTPASIYAVDNNLIYLTYNKNDNTLQILKSTDGGSNWSATQLSDSIKGTNDIIVTGTSGNHKIYISYAKTNTTTLKLAYSLDNGNTYSHKDITGTQWSGFSSITVNNDIAYIVRGWGADIPLHVIETTVTNGNGNAGGIAGSNTCHASEYGAPEDGQAQCIIRKCFSS